ncbi:MAG: hypothetical protein AAFX10_02820, partial [Pseudomonadota bacterium]
MKKSTSFVPKPTLASHNRPFVSSPRTPATMAESVTSPPNRGVKPLEPGAGVVVGAHGDEHGQVEIQLFGVQQGNAGAYDAL